MIRKILNAKTLFYFIFILTTFTDTTKKYILNNYEFNLESQMNLLIILVVLGFIALFEKLEFKNIIKNIYKEDVKNLEIKVDLNSETKKHLKIENKK